MPWWTYTGTKLETADTAKESLQPAKESPLLGGGVASGMRGGLSLSARRLSGTWEPETSMQTEKPQVEAPRGREYGSEDSGAGQCVVAEKSPIKGWSQGTVSRSLIQ
jgi:hypothetical protein